MTTPDRRFPPHRRDDIVTNGAKEPSQSPRKQGKNGCDFDTSVDSITVGTLREGTR